MVHCHTPTSFQPLSVLAKFLLVDRNFSFFFTVNPLKKSSLRKNQRLSNAINNKAKLVFFPAHGRNGSKRRLPMCCHSVGVYNFSSTKLRLTQQQAAIVPCLSFWSVLDLLSPSRDQSLSIYHKWNIVHQLCSQRLEKTSAHICKHLLPVDCRRQAKSFILSSRF